MGPELIERLRAVLAARVPVTFEGEARRRAAVLVPLFVREGAVHVVLQKRSDALRQHPGEVAFPGGGLDPDDESLQATALREAWEEVGISPSEVDLIGPLDDMPTAMSGYVIRPFVGVIPGIDSLRADGVEVDRILTPALALFTDPALRTDETRERDGVAYPFTSFDIEGDVVWGATARIVLTLLALLAGDEPPPVPVIPLPAV